jgi:myo-inositol-1-phosphate synthase
MRPIRVAIVGVGNCASSFVQGVEFYRRREACLGREAFDAEHHAGLRWPVLGGFRPSDIEFVAAFDVDSEKVGHRLSEAIYLGQNNTFEILDLRNGGLGPAVEARIDESDPVVTPAPVLDGLGRRLLEKITPVPESIDPVGRAPEPSSGPWSPVEAAWDDIEELLRETGAEVLINYLPVGSEDATRAWAELALRAGISFVNAIPVFIASDPEWEARFAAADLPIVGDDIKSQVGATILHRRLFELFASRGVRIDSSYQLNFGGNMDFWNMLNSDRLVSKKRSKTGAATSALPYELDRIHVSPSDYVEFLEDRKIAMLRVEGLGWGGAPMNIELRLDVWDSPNSAGVVVDAVRCCAIARDRGVGGALEVPSAWLMKTPPEQIEEAEALARFIHAWVGVENRRRSAGARSRRYESKPT